MEGGGMWYRYEDMGLHRDCYGDLVPARLLDAR